MKKFSVVLIALCLSINLYPQAENPHFSMITSYYSLDNMKQLKSPFGFSLEGAYFINDWLGTGGRYSTTFMNYNVNGYEGKSAAMSHGITANVYVLKKIYKDFTIMPSLGIGYAYTSLPEAVKKSENLPFEDVIGGTAYSSLLFNPLSVKGFWNFYQDMSAHISIDYNIAVSNKWPEKSFGEFLSFGIGYTYYLNFNKETK
jgi:hypothetical protein